MGVLTKIMVVCPAAIKGECESKGCLHFVKHEPVMVGKNTCQNIKSDCLEYTGKCVEWEG